MDNCTKTTCPYCGVGCGLLVSEKEDGGFTVSGDPDHPSNFGRICSKGAALGETLDLEGRLLHPKINGQKTNWSTATKIVASKFNAIIAEHGPDAVAFYVSGQLLTEDYYVANKLMKGFIGSGNIDSNSRLCMSSSVVGHKRIFGSDTVPGCYEDLDKADLVVLVGSNLAWCHPVLFQRLQKARAEHGTKIVVIDPRKTETCDIADIHLAIHPGTDVALFNGLFRYLKEDGHADENFTSLHTVGFEVTYKLAKNAGDNAAIAKTCDLDAAELTAFYELFAKTGRTVSVYSQGVNQSIQGSDKVNAIINCHLLTGRIGKVGAGPFSVTGQPNAMGGREVGALANMLAAHMDFSSETTERVQRFWQSPAIATKPGFKAVDLFKEMHAGKIKAIWIMATNPAVSMPNAKFVREALKTCEFVVLSDCMENTATAAYADVHFPATTWGERDGTVTNSERRISRQKPFLPIPEGAKHDWQIIRDVAKEMGHSSAFKYQNISEIFTEHAALSAFENNGQRDFNIEGFADLDKASYDQIPPTQWPYGKDKKTTGPRFFNDGKFFTPSGKANFVPVKLQVSSNVISDTYPLLLNTGRVRDHWHTMTRTGKSTRLALHRSEPFIDIHPKDIKSHGLVEGELTAVSSSLGKVVIRVRGSEKVEPKRPFIPIHWNDNVASNAVVGELINSEHDPLSGQPNLKQTPINIIPWRAGWYGFIISKKPIDVSRFDYWCKIQTTGCYLYEIAHQTMPNDVADLARDLSSSEGEWLSASDPNNGLHRFAQIENDALQTCLMISANNQLPPREWLVELFNNDIIDSLSRLGLLSGLPPAGAIEKGRIICSCNSVGIHQIIEAIQSGATTPDAVGTKCHAGTNCGSCRTEINELVGEYALQAAE